MLGQDAAVVNAAGGVAVGSFPRRSTSSLAPPQVLVRFTSTNRTPLIWLTANMFGIGLFFLVGSALWPISGLGNCEVDSGYAFTALLAWPALIFIGAAILASSVLAACAWRTNRALRIVAIATPLMLAVAAAYDFHRTFWANC